MGMKTKMEKAGRDLQQRRAAFGHGSIFVGLGSPATHHFGQTGAQSVDDNVMPTGWTRRRALRTSRRYKCGHSPHRTTMQDHHDASACSA